jgi:hypothetical protein
MRLVCLLVLALFAVSGCAAASAVGSRANDASMVSDNIVCEGAIPWSQARSHDGEIVTVNGPIVAARYAGSGQPTYLDIGEPAPATGRVEIVVSAADRKSGFPWAPERVLNGQTVCVRGVIHVHQNDTELDLSDAGNVYLVDTGARPAAP